jgi:hypothetical protein
MRIVMRAIIALVVATTSFGACTSSPSTQEAPGLGEARTNVGKIFWVAENRYVVGVKVCEDRFGQKCDRIEKGKFTVEGVKNLDGALLYKVAFKGGRTGFVNEHDLSYATNVDPSIAATECKRRGQPRVGMSVEQATATCWGKPHTVNRTQIGPHVHDQFVYWDDRYLYFQDGALTSIQMSGGLR